MKVVVETYINIVILFLCVFVSVEILGCNIQITKAKEYHQIVTDRISNSNFNETIIENCIDEAQTLGYHLTVIDDTIYADRQCRFVELKYSTGVPLLGVMQEGTISGYAK